MKHRKVFRWMSAGAAVLGMALCLPSAMMAQNDNGGATEPAANSTGMKQGKHKHHHKSAQKELDRMTKKLNLTQDQQTQILPILQESNQKMMSTRNDTSLSEQDRKQQMRQNMMDRNQKIEAVLNDTQKQQFEQHMQRHHHHGGMNSGGMNNGQGTPPPQ